MGTVFASVLRIWRRKQSERPINSFLLMSPIFAYALIPSFFLSSFIYQSSIEPLVSERKSRCLTHLEDVHANSQTSEECETLTRKINKWLVCLFPAQSIMGKIHLWECPQPSRFEIRTRCFGRPQCKADEHAVLLETLGPLGSHLEAKKGHPCARPSSLKMRIFSSSFPLPSRICW